MEEKREINQGWKTLNWK